MPSTKCYQERSWLRCFEKFKHAYNLTQINIKKSFQNLNKWTKYSSVKYIDNLVLNFIDQLDLLMKENMGYSLNNNMDNVKPSLNINLPNYDSNFNNQCNYDLMNLILTIIKK